MRLAADFVGAGSPANTGTAGAIHRGACFAGKPAPTEVRVALKTIRFEIALDRRQAPPCHPDARIKIYAISSNNCT
ncbi:protein of unknown function [Pseudomonas sp. JV551A1]|uniref:Uncharacterized protein n=1 Tax=Pseudomonas inefficax TaxID=2078786 RepID=A0AAQ1STY1_9PSED|nr:protein of unknown function [Pseudomonas sp. JV551A1]SPO61481.1 protein of unknown function [Pseudomonas inefficax]